MCEMWRLCWKHSSGYSWAIRIRCSRKNYKQERQMYLGYAAIQCGLFSTSSKKCLFHPQHEKDKIPKDYILIYENRLRKFIGPARVTSTAAGLASAAMCIEYIINFPETMEAWNVYIVSGICVFSLFMTAFFNMMFRYYLLRIYFNKEGSRFIGVYHGFLGNVKQVQYSPADLQAIKRPMAESLHVKCNVLLNGRTFHLKGKDFVLPKYYNMHLGLQ